MEPKQSSRFEGEALNAYRKAQSAASSAERSIADTYGRMAASFDNIEASLKRNEHQQTLPLIERCWLTLFYINSMLDSSQDSDIIARVTILNLFVMKRLARARRSGLASDVEGIGAVLARLSEIFLALDSAKQAESTGEHQSLQPEQAIRAVAATGEAASSWAPVQTVSPVAAAELGRSQAL
jgi:flagellin-specific chaperone FliS